jgi:four helix bundle protein
MAGSKRFEDVRVWQKAHAFTLNVYALTQTFPKHELFSLTSQLRRAAISIPANFAEGFRKRSKPEKARYYSIAETSAEECRYYLILAEDLGYATTGELRAQLAEVCGKLERYTQSMLNAHYLMPPTEREED